MNPRISYIGTEYNITIYFLCNTVCIFFFFPTVKLVSIVIIKKKYVCVHGFDMFRCVNITLKYCPKFSSAGEEVPN